MATNKISDAELKKVQTSNTVIREIIGAKLPIEGLKAEFNDGTVVLRGRAADQAARERAVALADRVPGVNRVDDRLEVGAAGSVGAATVVGSYTVKQGDTLSEIAQRELGAASRWKEIYEANRTIISDPDKIGVGQVLRMPAKK